MFAQETPMQRKVLARRLETFVQTDYRSKFREVCRQLSKYRVAGSYTLEQALEALEPVVAEAAKVLSEKDGNAEQWELMYPRASRELAARNLCQDFELLDGLGEFKAPKPKEESTMSIFTNDQRRRLNESSTATLADLRDELMEEAQLDEEGSSVEVKLDGSSTVYRVYKSRMGMTIVERKTRRGWRRVRNPDKIDAVVKQAGKIEDLEPEDDDELMEEAQLDEEGSPVEVKLDGSSTVYRVYKSRMGMTVVERKTRWGWRRVRNLDKIDAVVKQAGKIEDLEPEDDDELDERAPDESTIGALAGTQKLLAGAQAFRKGIQRENFQAVNRAFTMLMQGVSEAIGYAIDDDFLSEANARKAMAVRKAIGGS
jgi:hypothetical protein